VVAVGSAELTESLGPQAIDDIPMGHYVPLLEFNPSMPKHDQSITGLEALARLIETAQKDTGQSRRVADFLLAWHNAAENGGWDVTDLWNVDQSIVDDMFTVLHLIRAKQPVADIDPNGLLLGR
jgi:hypothetical protein